MNMQYFAGDLCQQNRWVLLRFLKSISQFDTSNLKYKLKKIYAVKYRTLIKIALCFSVFYLISMDASGNSLELTLKEYAKKGIDVLAEVLGIDINGLAKVKGNF